MTDRSGKHPYIWPHNLALKILLREGDSVKVLEEKEIQREKRWEGLSGSEKVADWALRHQYGMIMGGWAGSLGLAAAIISRQK